MSVFNWHSQPSQTAKALRRSELAQSASRRSVRKQLTQPKTLGKNTLAPIDYGRQVNAFTRA